MPNSKRPIQRASRTWLTIHDAGAGDADQERAAGDALGRRVVAAVGAPRRDAAAEPRERAAR